MPRGSSSTAAARSSLYGAIAAACPTIGMLVSTIVVARLLGPEAAGQFAYAAWLVSIGIVLADIGIPGALSRYLSELKAQGKTAAAFGLLRRLRIPAAAAALAVAGGLLVAATMQARGGAAGILGEPRLLPILAIVCLLQSWAAFAGATLRGLGQFRAVAGLAVIGLVAQVGSVAIAASTYGVWGAVASLAGPALPLALASLRRAATTPGVIQPELIARVRQFALHSWIFYIVSTFAWTRTEIFFLERSAGSIAVAHFSAGLTIANIVAQAPLLITGSLLPLLAGQIGEHGPARARGMFEGALRILALIVFPASVGLAALCPVLVPALFGDAFRPAVAPAMILSAAGVLVALQTLAITYLLAAEQTRAVLVPGLAAAALALCAGLTVIPLWGATGAAVSRTAIQALVCVALLVMLWKLAHFALPFRFLVRVTLSAFAVGLVAAGVTHALPGPIGIAAAIFGGIACYAVLLGVGRVLSKDDIHRLQQGVSLCPPPLAGRLSVLLSRIRTSAH